MTWNPNWKDKDQIGPNKTLESQNDKNWHTYSVKLTWSTKILKSSVLLGSCSGTGEEGNITSSIRPQEIPEPFKSNGSFGLSCFIR